MAAHRAWPALLAGGLLSACTTTAPVPPALVAATTADAVPVPTLERAPPAIAPRVELATPPAPPDLWDRLRAGYALPERRHARIDAQFRWYARHPDYLDRVSDRASRYLFHIVEEIERRGLPMELALLPIVESAFDPFAYSHGRAAGLWQFIPGTGRMYALDLDWWHDERRDVLESTRAALDHLEDLHRTFDGDWLLALAAYNSGSGNVRRALRRNRARGASEDFFDLDLPRETEAYVPKLLAIARLVRDPAAHDVALPTIPDAPYFAVVDTGGQVDLARAAALAELDGEVLYRLNPGLNRWATHPEGPHRLLVPLGHEDALREGLAELPEAERVAWRRHTIRPGENLSTIAARYDTEVSALQQANRLRGTRIRAGDALLIPTAAAAAERYALSEDQRQARRDAHYEAQGRTEQRYRVRPGDSFWTIARRHDVGVEALARWNGLATRDLLQPGQELVIWKDGGAADARVSPAREAVVRRLGYRVRRGDSLSRIATRFGVSVDDIVDWNAMDPTRYLQPGQQLVLFVNVVGGD
jgi:membrane-bound lytic murein transglycosylase D